MQLASILSLLSPKLVFFIEKITCGIEKEIAIAEISDLLYASLKTF